MATWKARGLRYRALPPRGSRWHACDNASVGYLDRTSFYLFHLHPPCGLLSRVKLDECKTSRSTYTEQIHTYPELIHVFAWGSLLWEGRQSQHQPLWQRPSFKRSVSLRFVARFHFPFYLNLSRTNSVRETAVHRLYFVNRYSVYVILRYGQFFQPRLRQNFLVFFFLLPFYYINLDENDVETFANKMMPIIKTAIPDVY